MQRESETYNNIDNKEYVRLIRDDRYVIYSSDFETTTILNGNERCGGTQIIYRIGRRYKLFRIRNNNDEAVNNDYDENTDLGANVDQNNYDLEHPNRYCDKTFLKSQDMNRVKQSFEVSSEYKEAFANYTRKNHLFNRNVEYSDMSCIIFNLTRMLCFYCLNGYLDFTRIRTNHGNIRITSLDSANVQNNLTESCVFIPNSVNYTGHAAMFYALVMATHLSGASILTDHLQIRADTRVPEIQTYRDRELADGVYMALQLMFSIYEANNASTLASIAFVKGLHDMFTVVGQSDEGACMREVFRKCNFSIPYGVIIRTDELSLSDDIKGARYMNFPNLNKCQLYKLQNFLHGMTLKTAALVAEAQPIVTYGTRKYPFVSCCDDELIGNVTYNPIQQNNHNVDQTLADITVREMNELLATFSGNGINANRTQSEKNLLMMQLMQRQQDRFRMIDGNDGGNLFNYDADTLSQIAMSHWENISDVCDIFCEKYVELLNQIMCTRGYVQTGVKFMLMQFTKTLGNDSRHLHNIIVAPFFWIEPTSLFKYKLECSAEEAGFACLNGTMEREIELKAFEDVNDVKKRTGTSYTFKCKFRSARTSNQFLFNSYFPRDGLAHMKIVQSATDDWLLYGGNDSIYNMLDADGAHPENIVSVNNLFWNKGDNPMFHPAECIYIGEEVMIRVQDRGYDRNDMIIPLPVPNVEEIANAKIRFCVSKPQCLGLGTINAIPGFRERGRYVYDHVQRRNGKAMRVLNKMSQFNRMDPSETGNQFETGNVLTPAIRVIMGEEPERIKDHRTNTVHDEDKNIDPGVQRTFGNPLAIRTIDTNVKPRPANNRDAAAGLNVRNDDNNNQNNGNNNVQGGAENLAPPEEN